MSALTDIIIGDTHPSAVRLRNIENNYHLSQIAASNQDIVQFQAASLEMQARVGQATCEQLAQSNQSLADIACQLADIADGMHDLNATALRTEAAVVSLTGVMGQWLSTISQQLGEQQRTLNDIASMMRNPRGTAARELRDRAEEDMRNGMRTTGSRRDEWYGDALQLLGQSLEDPIGKHDYVAWLQIGWLKWKHENDLPAAEANFDRAVRLSLPKKDAYCTQAIRHLAYMKYLQANQAGAYDAIQEGVGISREHDTLYDAARYASVTGRHDEALRLLRECIGLQPTTIAEMWSEPDFGGL